MINKIILGTVQLGLDYGINNHSGKPSKQRAFQILENAHNFGITKLDTAESYGNSEYIIGDFHKENPNKIFDVITKLAANSDLAPKNFMRHIAESCNRLYVDRLYGYMFHNYKSFKDKEGLYEQLLLAKDKGLIKKAGISLYNNEELEDVLEHYNNFDLIQIPFNLLDNASKRQNVLEKAKEKNVEVHTRSVFLQGVFFKKIKSLPKKLEPLGTYLITLENIMLENDIDTQALALNYVLQKNYIDNVLIGVETPEQLVNNIKACNNDNHIPHDIIDAIIVKEKELLNPSNWN